MPSTVPLSQHHNFGIRDKGFPHKHTAQGHRHTPQHTKESPGNILLPGPPIRIKGFPRLEYNPSYLLPPKTYLSMYA
jgi:hypothetical protein